MEQLFLKYEQKINNLINQLKDQIVVFDFDGTLTEVRHSSTSLLPCRDADLDHYALTHDIYAIVKPLEIMQYVVSKLNPDNLYILTVSKPNVVAQKQRCIERHYPTIIKHHIMHVPNADAKLVALQQLHADKRNNIVLIDDSLQILLNAEEKLCFIRAIHTSSLMI